MHRLLLTLATASFAAAALTAQNRYTVTTVPAPPGQFNSGNALNDSAEVTGSTGYYGFHWTPSGGTVSLPAFSGGTTSDAFDISPSGAVVGNADTGTGFNAATLWTPQNGGGYTLTNLGILSGDIQSTALGASGSGNLCGVSDNGYRELPVVWPLGNSGYQLVALPLLSGDTYGSAEAINASGGVVVGASGSGGLETAVRWDAGNSGWTASALGGLGASATSYATGINQNGTIVGTAVSPSDGLEHLVIWAPTIVDLGTFDDDLTWGNAINDNGEIVGAAFDLGSQTFRALYTSPDTDGLADLNQWLPPQSPWHLYRANDINQSGQITGDGTYGGVGSKTFLLTPVQMGLEGPTPGVAGQSNTFVATGATPGHLVRFYFASAGGEAPIDGCYLTLDLASPSLLGTATALPSGEAVLQVPIPGGASQETFLFQATDSAGCRLSSVVEYTF